MFNSHQVQEVELTNMTLGESSSKHLAEWLCGLPDLTDLKLARMVLADGFYAMAAGKAATTKVSLSHTVTYLQTVYLL